MNKGIENRRQRSCWEVARRRQIQARRNGHSHARAQLVFLMALLSLILLPPSPAPPVVRPTPPNRPPNSPRIPSGYKSPPSLRKLIKDLHRPGGKAVAKDLLLSRIPDQGLRSWIAAKIEEGQLSELAMYVRSDLPEQEVFARWRNASIAEVESETDDRAPSRKGTGGGYRRGL